MTSIKLTWDRDAGDPESEKFSVSIACDNLDPLFKQVKSDLYNAMVDVARIHLKNFGQQQTDDDVRRRIAGCEEIYIDISTAYDGFTVTFRSL